MKEEESRRKSVEAYLLELLDGTTVDTTALVDQVTGLYDEWLALCSRVDVPHQTTFDIGTRKGVTYGGRLSGVDVAVVASQYCVRSISFKMIDGIRTPRRRWLA